ncbi:MAG: UvrB/UvrC motif-containing protein [Christensenellales bacterium]
MLCEQCKEKNATVHLMQSLNGKKAEKFLCVECAKQSGMIQPPSFSIHDLISGYFDQSTPHQTEEKTCPNCHTASSWFRQNGRLGCPQCYDAFRGEIMPMLKKLHGRTVHTGMVPAASVCTQDETCEIKRLQHELKEAVGEENYELAAVLRDKIKRLENGGDTNVDE